MAAARSPPPGSRSWKGRKNYELYTTLDFSTPEGKHIFLKLIEACDIWMESSKPGSYTKWGLMFSDEVVLQTNPKMLSSPMCRTACYGQSARCRTCGLSGPGSLLPYDMIRMPPPWRPGPRFGGLMYQTGFPDPEPPVRANPWTRPDMRTIWAGLRTT